MNKSLNLIIVVFMTIFLASCMAPTGAAGWSNPLVTFLPLLLLIIIIGVIILVAVKTNKEDNVDVSSDQRNKVVNITLTGGLIGLFGASPQNSLNNRITKENANGWRVVQVIPADSGNVFLTIFRLLLLVITLFLYTTANGYYIIMERTQVDKQNHENNP